MWNIPKIWDGGQCIIIGGGTSVPREFGVPESIIEDVYKGILQPDAYSPYMAAIHNQHIIAVNMAYKLGDWIDCVFFGDQDFLNNHQVKFLNWSGLRVTLAPASEVYQGRLKVVERDNAKKLGISPDPNKICWNLNSGSAAIDLATKFGATRIILLGFDMKLDQGQNQHWHKFYASNLKTVNGTMNRHLQSFPVIARDLKGKVEILNCSPDSAIESFPKLAFKDVKL